MWRLALDNVEQSQGFCVIVDLGRERYAEKPIIYIPLQVSVFYTSKYKSNWEIFFFFWHHNHIHNDQIPNH